MRVKVCGNRDVGVFQSLLDSAVDYLGLILVSTSARFVNRAHLDVLQEVYERKLGKKPELVGVFVNPEVDEVLTLQDRGTFSVFQFHGNESPNFLERLRDRTGPTIEFWKAISVTPPFPQTFLRDFVGTVSSFIFDGKAGGSGEKFDWRLLAEYSESVPFYLAGGVGPSDVEILWECARLYPALRGVDINSRFEVSPGVKDFAAIELFIRELQS